MTRGRKARVDRPRRMDIQLPQSVHEKLTHALYSEIEGRVPHGAYSTLFTVLVEKWLAERGEPVT